MKNTTLKINLKQFITSSRGISVGWALLGLGMVASAALLISSIFVWQNSSRIRNDRRVAIQNSLLTAAASIRSASYFNVIKMCDSKKPSVASEDWVLTSKCFYPAGTNTFNPSFTPEEAGPSNNSNAQKIVDVRMNFEGNSDPTGQTCVYIKNCKERVPEGLVSVTLAGAWRDPDPNRPGLINRTELVVEKVK